MPIKKGTKKHKYTDEELKNIGNGIFLDGVDVRSQLYSYQRWVKKKIEQGYIDCNDRTFYFNEDCTELKRRYLW